MKIKTWIKYDEMYLPPRCRNPKHRECEEYVDIELKETNFDMLKLAFEDNSYNGQGKIYLYEGKLWTAVYYHTTPLGASPSWCKAHNITSSLDYLKWISYNSSRYFCNSNRELVVAAAQKDMDGFLLVDGILYTQTREPRYEIVTFGLGNNHGGTGMFCAYLPQDVDERYCFSALEGDKAVKYANEVATRRGDTNDVGTFHPFIVCHMPELVTVNKNKKN